MSEFLIVRINEKLIPDFQINYNAKTNTAQKVVVSSWSEIQANKNQQIILIIAAELVFNTHVSIPSKNEEVIRQSIPFAIEEIVASDINENHCAYHLLSENKFMVSVISLENINQIKQLLKIHNLNCEKLYSEIFSIPTFNNQLSILYGNESLLLNENQHEGTRITIKALPKYLQLCTHKNSIIFSDVAIDLKDYVDAMVKVTDTALLQSQTIVSGSYVNLFQGVYNSANKESDKKNPWKKLLILSAVLILSWLTISLNQIWKLNAAISQIKNQQLAFLQKAIPNANQTQKNAPYAAIQSFLKRKENSKDSNDFSGLMTPLYYLGKTLTAFPDVQVQSLRKRENKLEIKLLAPGVNVLNKFQSNLDKMALSMRVKIGTRDSSKDGIVSIITMEQL